MADHYDARLGRRDSHPLPVGPSAAFVRATSDITRRRRPVPGRHRHRPYDRRADAGPRTLTAERSTDRHRPDESPSDVPRSTAAAARAEVVRRGRGRHSQDDAVPSCPARPCRVPGASHFISPHGRPVSGPRRQPLTTVDSPVNPGTEYEVTESTAREIHRPRPVRRDEFITGTTAGRTARTHLFRTATHRDGGGIRLGAEDRDSAVGLRVCTPESHRFGDRTPRAVRHRSVPQAFLAAPSREHRTTTP